MSKCENHLYVTFISQNLQLNNEVQTCIGNPTFTKL